MERYHRFSAPAPRAKLELGWFRTRITWCYNSIYISRHPVRKQKLQKPKSWDGTPWKINMEPTNRPFRKENDLQTFMIMFHVNLQGCIYIMFDFKNIIQALVVCNFHYSIPDLRVFLDREATLQWPLPPPQEEPEPCARSASEETNSPAPSWLSSRRVGFDVNEPSNWNR